MYLLALRCQRSKKIPTVQKQLVQFHHPSFFENSETALLADAESLDWAAQMEDHEAIGEYLHDMPVSWIALLFAL